MSDKKLIASFIAGAAVLIAVAVVADSVDAKKWSKFATEHHCFAVGKSAGRTVVGTGVGVGSSGEAVSVVTTGYVSPTVTFRCDDGVDYTRNE